MSVDPSHRTLESIMKDPWVSIGQEGKLKPYTEPPWGDLDPQVTETIKILGFELHEIQESVTEKKCNHIIGMYVILHTTENKMKGHAIKVRPCPSPDSNSRLAGQKTRKSARPSASLKSRRPSPPPSMEARVIIPQLILEARKTIPPSCLWTSKTIPQTSLNSSVIIPSASQEARMMEAKMTVP